MNSLFWIGLALTVLSVGFASFFAGRKTAPKSDKPTEPKRPPPPPRTPVEFKDNVPEIIGETSDERAKSGNPFTDLLNEHDR